jgi:hypothetical protein
MHGLARILRQGEARGAGFLISPRHLATCAHVVNLALDADPRAQGRPGPDQGITLDFPNDAPDPPGRATGWPERTATVVCWHPPTPRGAEPGPHDDIAVLLLDRPRAPAAVPRLAPVGDPPPAGTQGYGWGTPHGTKDGLWASVTLSGTSGVLRQIDLSHGPEVQPGFSGGPFTDPGQALILGMVVQIDAGARAAWMLTLGALRPAWEALRVIELGLHLRDGRLHAAPDGPTAGTALADLRAAAERGDLAALYRALFGAADPGQRLAALDPTAGLDALGLGPKRLRLRCMDDAAAGLPWHCLRTPSHERLGDAGWVIEVVGPTPRPAALRSIHRALILAPADSRLAPGVHPHVDLVSAALAPLLPHPRLCQVPWAVNRHDLARELMGEPDLIYCYARLDAAGCLSLGRDPLARESICLAELVEQLAALPDPPLLWLHCVEVPGARLDLDRLLTLTREYPLLLVQRTGPDDLGESLQTVTLDGLKALAALPGTGPSEPAAVLSRLGSTGSCARLGQDGLRLARPADPDAVLYASIRASLLQLLLGRTAEKDLLAGRFAVSGGEALLLYFVCGPAKARVHDFPEQCRWHLEDSTLCLRVRPQPIPALLRPDQTGEDLIRLLRGGLQIDPHTGTAMTLLKALGPIPGETLILSLAWLLEPADGCTPHQVAGWVARWKQAVLKVFGAAQIPEGVRVLAGCCLQWEADWPQRHGGSAPEIQRAAVAELEGGNPPHCDWVQFERPLDRLRRGELDKFFGQEQRRLAPYTQGLERGALVAWVWDQTGAASSRTRSSPSTAAARPTFRHCASQARHDRPARLRPPSGPAPGLGPARPQGRPRRPVRDHRHGRCAAARPGRPPLPAPARTGRRHQCRARLALAAALDRRTRHRQDRDRLLSQRVFRVVGPLSLPGPLRQQRAGPALRLRRRGLPAGRLCQGHRDARRRQ